MKTFVCGFFKSETNENEQTDIGQSNANPTTSSVISKKVTSTPPIINQQNNNNKIANKVPIAKAMNKNQNQKIPTVIAGYETEKNNEPRNTAINAQSNYRASAADVGASQAAGSTLPLVATTRKKGGEEEYNPFEHRHVPHPTSDMDTLIHLLKGSLGSGILAMPMAFYNSGLWFGLIATITIGAICTYCVHILVKCSQILCRRRQIPSMGFADIAEQAFLDGPDGLHKWSRFVRFLINSFLVVDLLGCCCIYLVFVARNLKQLIDFYMDIDLNIRAYIAIILIPLMFMCLINNLKYLTPFSMIANILMFIGVCITFTFIFTDLPNVNDRVPISNFAQWPLFFGTVIFALEGIGVVMSLENDMKTPAHFIGCPGVLNFGMGTVIVLYTLVGFFGYLKYGDETKGSITLNLPIESWLAQSVKIMIAIAIYLTFTLQFYVPVSIVWKGVQKKIPEERQLISEYAIRVGLVIVTGAIAIALPNLGPFISLIGAVCLSTLGLMVPAIIELVVYREDPGYGKYNWRIWKNCFLVFCGIIGFFTGTYVSIQEFVVEFRL